MKAERPQSPVLPLGLLVRLPGLAGLERTSHAQKPQSILSSSAGLEAERRES